MKNLVRSLSFLIIIAATIIVGYTIGKRAGRNESRAVMIDNYAFVREIAELSSLEVSGVTTYKSTNVANDDSWTSSLHKMFLEKTVQMQVPFIAKYGVDLNDSNMTIKKNGDVLEIHLPKPRLLSYEVRLDRMTTMNQKGWLQFEDENMYTEFQKRMYQQNRKQLESNALYLNQSQDKICGIIQRYFKPLNIKTSCFFTNAQLIMHETMHNE